MGWRYGRVAVIEERVAPKLWALSQVLRLGSRALAFEDTASALFGVESLQVQGT